MHPYPPRCGRSRAVAGASGLALLLAVLSGTTAVAAPTAASVTVVATSETTVGEPVDVTVDLAGSADVYAYELTVTFDPDLFRYVPDSASGPAGGFDAVQEGDGTVTLVHSRLGTSPALDGDIEASLSLATVGTGTGSVDASSVTLVDAAGATAELEDAGTTAVVVTPVATPAPTPTPTASPEPTPAPSSSATPGPSAAPVAPSAAPPAAGRTTSAGGSLARTGAELAGLALASLAAVAAGAGVLVLRRRAVRS